MAVVGIWCCSDDLGANELQKLYEFQSQTQTKYFRDLITLDAQYSHHIEALLQQKESIKLKLKQKYETQLANITSKMGSIVIKSEMANDNLNVNDIKSEWNELDINNASEIGNNNDCSDQKLDHQLQPNKARREAKSDSKMTKKKDNNQNKKKIETSNVESKLKMSKDSENNNNNNNGKNTIVKLKKGKLNGKIYKKIIKSNGSIVYKCNYNHCHKKLSTVSGIVIHYYGDHTTKYQCNVCQKCFGRQSLLDIHSRIHSGEKPFKCNNCDKSFAQRSNLTIHIRTHTGEKPYKCNHCGRKFSRNVNLKFHQKNCRE